MLLHETRVLCHSYYPLQFCNGCLILQKMGTYFFIESKLAEYHMVMNVEKFSSTPGTRVNSYPQKHPAADNQLWMKELVGETKFHLVSKLSPSCRITIKVSIISY